MRSIFTFLSIIVLSLVSISTSFAQDNTQVGLPEGAIARFGKGGINVMRFSPDGTRLIVGTDVGVWLYDVPDGKETALLTRENGQVNALAYSPDGKILASGGFANPIIQLWEIGTGRKVSRITLEGYRGAVSSLTFSKDGKTLISLDKYGRVAHWDINTGEKLSNFSDHIPAHFVGTLSEKDNLYAIGDSNGKIRISDAVTDKQRANLLGHGGLLKRNEKEISVLAFSSDEKILASGGYDRTVRLWSTENRTNLAILRGHESTVTSIAFSGDGKKLASGDARKIIKLWDIETRKEHATLKGHSNEICALAFSPDGNTLASGSYDGTIRFWNPHTGKAISNFTSGHIDAIKTVTFFENATTLLSVSNNGSVEVWEENTLREKLTFMDDEDTGIRAAALLSDGIHVAVIYSNHLIGGNNLKVWNLTTAKELQGPWSNVQDTVNAVTFSPNSKILVASYRQKGMFLWHINAEMEIFHFDIKHFWESKFTYSSDGNILAKYGESAETYIWNAKTMEEITQINIKNIRSLAFSPESKILATRVNEEIILWDITSSGIKQRGRFINSKYKGKGDMRPSPDDLMFSPDGNILLSITSEGWDHYIQLWGVNTGWNLGKISGHSKQITTFDFSSDGEILASGSMDGTMLLWDWEQTVSKLREVNIGKNQDVFLLPSKDAAKYANTAAEAEAVKNWLRISEYVIKKSYNRYSIRHRSSFTGFSGEVGSTYCSGDLDIKVESEGILQIRVEDVGLATYAVDEKGNLTHKEPDKTDKGD